MTCNPALNSPAIILLIAAAYSCCLALSLSEHLGTLEEDAPLLGTLEEDAPCSSMPGHTDMSDCDVALIQIGVWKASGSDEADVNQIVPHTYPELLPATISGRHDNWQSVGTDNSVLKSSGSDASVAKQFSRSDASVAEKSSGSDASVANKTSGSGASVAEKSTGSDDSVADASGNEQLIGPQITPDWQLVPDTENVAQLLSRQGPNQVDPSIGRKLLLLHFPVGIVVSCLIWAILLAGAWMWPWRHVSFKQQAADRALGTLHACVVSPMGIVAELFITPQCTVGDSWMVGALQLSVGFLIVDAVSMLVCDIINGWRPIDYPMLIHHVFISVCFSLGCAYDVGVWVAVSLMINELSTPLVHALWYLQYTERKTEKLYLAVGLALVISFFFCRIAFIPYSFVQLARLDYCQQVGGTRAGVYWLMVPAYAVMYVLNLFWFTKGLKGAIKKLCGEPVVDEVHSNAENLPLLDNENLEKPAGKQGDLLQHRKEQKDLA